MSNPVVTFKTVKEECGEQTAMQLFTMFAGQRVYIPKAVNTKSRVTDAVSNEALETLVEEFAGHEICVPVKYYNIRERRAKIKEFRADGQIYMSIQEMATELGVSSRTIHSDIEAIKNGA